MVLLFLYNCSIEYNNLLYLYNDLGFPIRINSETNSPEWKDVGADTWYPFKSGGQVKELLWVNPRATVDENFNAQTINLDLEDYEEFIIETVYGNGHPDQQASKEYTLCTKGTNNVSCGNYPDNKPYGRYVDTRTVIITDNSIYFGDAYQSEIKYNNRCIPQKIYGLRNGIPISGFVQEPIHKEEFTYNFYTFNQYGAIQGKSYSLPKGKYLYYYWLSGVESQYYHTSLSFGGNIKYTNYVFNSRFALSLIEAEQDSVFNVTYGTGCDNNYQTRYVYILQVE